VQIDVPETLSVEGRAAFYDATGAYRDMIVTHLFQVMGFVAMEPPASLAAGRCGQAGQGVRSAEARWTCGTWCAASTPGTDAGGSNPQPGGPFRVAGDGIASPGRVPSRMNGSVDPACLGRTGTPRRRGKSHQYHRRGAERQCDHRQRLRSQPWEAAGASDRHRHLCGSPANRHLADAGYRRRRCRHDQELRHRDR
jgi:hypothetical protein